MPKTTIRPILATLALLACGVTRAATFCVGNAAELDDALAAATTNGADDVIRIESGTYAATDGGVAFAYSTSATNDIEISGGWQSGPSLPCFAQTGNAGATILDGGGVRRVLRVQPLGAGGDVKVSNLTVRRGFSPDSGGGLEVAGLASSVGNVEIDRVIVRGNEATTFGAGLRTGTNGTLTVTNSFFTENVCRTSGCAASISTAHPTPTVIRARFGNNTIALNGCASGASASCHGGVRFFGTGRVVIYNNAFADNEALDIELDAANNVVDSNLFDALQGVAGGGGNNVSYALPGFVNPGAGNYQLLATSPLRNAGTLNHPVGTIDLLRADRINGVGVDIGAYENQSDIFASGFETLQ